MATETRVFESVDNSPEAKAANAAYFAGQGIESKVEDSAVAGQPETPPATDKTPPAAAAPVETKPGEGEVEEGQVDTETAADWESAQTDGKRKSRYAKKRQEARELKAANEKLERELAELKAKQTPPATETKPGDKAPPAAGTEATPPAAAAPDATAATFTEPEPVEPKYEDFANEDDQLLAWQKAVSKHTKEWSRWDRRRENFETQQAAAQTRRTEEAKTAREQRLAKLNENLTEIRTKHPDFDQVLQQGNILTAALSGASTVVPGGLEAAYLLAKDPDKLKQFNEQTSETQVVNGQKVPTQAAWDRALFLLGQITGSAAPAPAPAGSPPAASPSSSSQPREEPAAPRAARGRASDEPRREDLSGDERRDRLARELAR